MSRSLCIKLVDRDWVGLAAAPKLTIYQAILLWERLVHLYRV